MKSGIFSILFLLFLVFFCTPLAGAANQSRERLQIHTVNYPLAYFAKRIAPSPHAKVVFPAPLEQDPAYWMPDEKTIVQFQKADLILLNGAGYAKWTEKVSLPSSKSVNTSKGFRNKYIYSNEAVTHSHGPQGAHAHENLAFTTWMDLSCAVLQAEAVAKAIARKRPEIRNTVEKNLKALEKDLLAMDRQLFAIVSLKKDIPLMVSHPVYDYLAQRYGLNIKSVHWEPDQVPNSVQVAQLKKILKTHPARWMLWEGNPHPDSIATLKAIGMKSVVFSPCSNRPDNKDFLTVMSQNIENLKRIYQ